MSACCALAAALVLAAQTAEPQPLAHVVVHGAGRLAASVATAYARLGMDGLFEPERVLASLLQDLPCDANAIDRTGPSGVVIVAAAGDEPERVVFCTSVHGEARLAGRDEAAEAAARDHAVRSGLFERHGGGALVSVHADLAAIAPRFDRAVASRAAMLRAGSKIASLFGGLQGEDAGAGVAAERAAALLERLPGVLAPWRDVTADLHIDATALRIEGSLAPAEGSAAATWLRSLRPPTPDRLQFLPRDAAAFIDLGPDASFALVASSGGPAVVAVTVNEAEGVPPEGEHVLDEWATDAPVRGYASLPDLWRLAAAQLGIEVAAPTASGGALTLSAWPEGDALRFRIVLPLAHLRAAIPCVELR